MTQQSAPWVTLCAAQSHRAGTPTLTLQTPSQAVGFMLLRRPQSDLSAFLTAVRAQPMPATTSTLVPSLMPPKWSALVQAPVTVVRSAPCLQPPPCPAPALRPATAPRLGPSPERHPAPLSLAVVTMPVTTPSLRRSAVPTSRSRLTARAAKHAKARIGETLAASAGR